MVCNEPSTQQTKQDVKITTAVATAAVATSAVATAAVATTAVSPGQEVIRTPRDSGGSSHSGHYGKHTGTKFVGFFFLITLNSWSKYDNSFKKRSDLCRCRSLNAWNLSPGSTDGRGV